MQPSWLSSVCTRSHIIPIQPLWIMTFALFWLKLGTQIIEGEQKITALQHNIEYFRWRCVKLFFSILGRAVPGPRPEFCINCTIGFLPGTSDQQGGYLLNTSVSSFKHNCMIFKLKIKRESGSKAGEMMLPYIESESTCGWPYTHSSSCESVSGLNMYDWITQMLELATLKRVVDFF